MASLTRSCCGKLILLSDRLVQCFAVVRFPASLPTLSIGENFLTVKGNRARVPKNAFPRVPDESQLY
jgi:hypothetical protein